MKKTLFLFAGLAVASAAYAAPSQQPIPEGATTRIVVKYKSNPNTALAQTAQALKIRAQAVSERAQVGMAQVKETASGAVVYEMASPVPLTEARVMALRIAQDPAVAYAAPDIRVKAHAMPNDTWASSQWSLQAAADAFGGSNFFSAQGISGNNRVTVAVIDSGSAVHSDLSSNVIQGYDFVSDTEYSGDGNGRDNDPTDPGDYCDADGTDSSWHGLKVASLIGAATNNGSGIAGAASRNTQVLQVRALGRCGGWLSDVADAITWSAGGQITGVPTNGTPARVINLSLGAPAGSACFTYLQDSINYARSRNAVVIASAGNEADTVVGTPASCSGAIVVGAHTRSGDLALYSNRSSAVALTGPGGGACQSQGSSCQSVATIALGNSGTRSPSSELASAYFSGTSAATPHVAAAAAMVLAVKGDLTPDEVKSVLVSSTRPHAQDSFCFSNVGMCGSGMLDANAAVLAVSGPTLTTQAPATAVAGGSSVSLRVTAAGGTGPYTYAWTRVSGPTVALTGASSANLTFSAPAIKGDAVVVLATVTDALGSSVSEMFSVRVNNKAVILAPTSAQAETGTAFVRALSGTDPDGDAVSLVLLSGPSGASLQGNVLTWNQPVVGTHQFNMMATDNALDGTGDSATHVLTVVVTASQQQPPASEPSGSGGNSAGQGGSSSGGGGGGSVPLVGLLALMAAAVVAARKG